MKLEIEFNDREKSQIKKAFLLSVLRKTLEKIERGFLAEKNLSLSLAAVEEEEMQMLNRAFRRKNAVTDVLSFVEYKSKKELSLVGDKDIFLGEIILCYNYIAEYAHKNKEAAETELARVVSHGLLHLLGFRHGKKMFQIQDAVAEKR